MMTKIKLLLLIVVTILFSGCAFTNYEIQTPYKPIGIMSCFSNSLEKAKGSKKYSVFTEVNYQPVFQDDPKAIGVKKNGYGWETARIYLYENVADWLKKGFDEELKIAGFDVVNRQHNNVVKITLNVRQIFIEPWVGFWSVDMYGILKIEAKLELPNKNSYYVKKIVAYDKRQFLFGLNELILQLIAKTIIGEIVIEICPFLS